MGLITEDMLRRRAEHNDGMLISLKEISLHQQGIERIELINQACRHLRILYLQNNLISKIENLNRLKELEYLNLAVNNITRVENLERCESLRKLDLTLNFVPPAALSSLASLRPCLALRELHLVGNPCTAWPGYRAYVSGTLPQLRRLDGDDIAAAEREAALADLPALQLQLELLGGAGEGRFPGDPRQGPRCSPSAAGEHAEVRPWCPATRLLDHQEHEQQARQAEQAKQAAKSRLTAGDGGSWRRRPRRGALPVLVEGQEVMQCNEGGWEFTLQESDDGGEVVLSVALPRHLDTAAVQADVRPSAVRLLATGRLLQLRLPAEVSPDKSSARRSKATGRLVITMPIDRGEVWAVPARPRRGGGGALKAKSLASKFSPQASVAVALMDEAGGEDDLPPVTA